MPQQYIDKHSLELIRRKLWTMANEKGITLEDIQNRTGISYSQVYRILRGVNNTSVSNILKVCTALELQPTELFDFKLAIPKYPLLRKERKKIVYGDAFGPGLFAVSAAQDASSIPIAYKSA